MIALENGLHVRPAANFSRRARRFRSNVRLLKNNNSYDGKNVYDLLGMCVSKGETVCLVTDGEDERAAFSVLSAMLTRGEAHTT